jgi:TonB family protein
MSRRRILAFALFLLTVSAWAQAPGPSNPPRFDVGTIDAGFYINDCLGFSYPIPDGWQVNADALGTPPGTAKHESGGNLLLLVIDQHTKRPFFNRVVVSATNASAMTFDTAGFVSHFVHAQTGGDNSGSRKILKEAYPVDFAGKHFYRSDYSDARTGATLYKAFLSTKFRGYFLGWTIVASAPEEVDAAVNTLQKMVFRQDQPDPACTMGPDEARPADARGVAASTPPPAGGPQQRVRISQGVAETLIVKKVQPAYPDAARFNQIQGNVILRAEIDTEGNVQQVVLISGHPMLAPAAIAAVKQWKYKPYLLNGKPVNVETQATVIFQLRPRF